MRWMRKPAGLCGKRSSTSIPPLAVRERLSFTKSALTFPWRPGEELMSSQTTKYESRKFRGSLASLDANTGRLVWKTYTISDPPKQYKTNSQGTAMYGPAGAGIWSAPTVDEKRKHIYVGTGNSFTGIDIHTSDAIAAFDLDTGRLPWANQVTSRRPGSQRFRGSFFRD
jgi:outer membrane protein assembly factor BamB